MLELVDKTTLSCVLIGDESLLIGCGDQLLDHKSKIHAVVTGNADVQRWANGRAIPVLPFDSMLVEALQAVKFDWLLSIANLRILPDTILNIADKGAVNFHDGPLPKYAGVNTPVWAILNGEDTHGITWHLIENGVDVGEIIAQRVFEVSEGETALSLNSKCYAAGLESFTDVVDQLQNGLTTKAQDFAQRTYFSRAKRPTNNGLIDFDASTAQVMRLVQALDHGHHWNPLCTAKFINNGKVYHVGSATVALRDGAVGTVLDFAKTTVTIATSDGAVALALFQPDDHLASELSAEFSVGSKIVQPDHLNLPDFDILARADEQWRQGLSDFRPAQLPLKRSLNAAPSISKLALKCPSKVSLADKIKAALMLGQLSTDESGCDIAFASMTIAGDKSGMVNHWLPVLQSDLQRDWNEAVKQLQSTSGFAADLILRDPALTSRGTPDIVANEGDCYVEGAALTLAFGSDTLFFDETRIDPAYADLLQLRYAHILGMVLSGQTPSSDLLPRAERDMITDQWNRTNVNYDTEATIHSCFELQAAKTPDATSVVFEATALSYSELNAQANKVAHCLIGMGVTPGMPVALYLDRSADMVIAALAILKAGGAYVPMDPKYPSDRIAHYLSNSKASVVVSHSNIAQTLPSHKARVLKIDTNPQITNAADTNPEIPVGSDSLAYLIYTSGSTGTPKGVMVTHRNVVNFFAGMDACVPYNDGDAWLAVTSLSFDISVLELFYTLARGFKTILSGAGEKALASRSVRRTTDKRIDFGLYYWGTSDGTGDKSYNLLLEGAKFADQNGFCAVWTPERHFHAFGGAYPNPSVTGAAVAAVTNNVAVRAGSCVAPLHHPARIAEEWAVIDNMTGGRAGLAMASGWQPDDFVLRPENTPPENKPALFETIEAVRKLWRGEEVAFPTKSGEPHNVVTHPRPTSDELPIWVTTAGNPETWVEAGKNGANILTHLLGQSIDEVADKIRLYHDALRAAGYTPSERTVTLMLHSFVGTSRDEVKEIVREPMKDYLRSAAGLIKQYAWAFPAFKKPEGVSNPFQIDLATLEDDEMEAILDFAFLRYFEDAGLFGTVADCVKRADALRAIGVDEIGCLIDFGVEETLVLGALSNLASTLSQVNSQTTIAEDDFSIAAQIIRHNVTHLQCTPSMARMLTMNEEASAALSNVKHLFIGGEALPGDLVRSLQSITSARIMNMYGPTETTIWSTTHLVKGESPSIGCPIANTQVYVLDAQLAPVPVGVAGDLYIAGHGVTDGYWQREAQTQERFVPNPITGGGKMYHTGDLVRWRADGQLDYLGRTDNQVKIRGHRIELGEIEDRLAILPSVTGAVALAQTERGDTRLIAYVTGGASLDLEGMQRALSETLPNIMVPAGLIHVEAFPLTPNKKIDRTALAKVKPAMPCVIRPKRRVLNAGVAQQITQIWSDVLGITYIQPSDNFFALGGHSLLAVQAHREMRKQFPDANLSVTDIFALPVLQDLATRIDGTSSPKRLATTNRATDVTNIMAKRREMRSRRLAVIG